MGDRETVLIVDDEETIRLGCKRILTKAGYNVELAATGEEGVEKVKDIHQDLYAVVLDLMLPGIGGMEVLKEIRKIDQDIPVIVITGYATVEKAVEAMKSGAYDFISKPFTPDQLRLTVGRAVERRRLKKERGMLRKEMERSLRDVAVEKSRVKAIVNSMTEGLMVTNAQGEIVLMNPKAKLYLGVEESCVGKMVEEVFREDSEFLKLYREIHRIKNGECNSISGELLSGDTYLKVDISPFREDSGDILGFVVVLNDITELKRLDQMKSEFVSMVSHELRAPVGAISQQLSLLLKGYVGELTDRQREILERIKDRCNGLLELVKDLLDLAKIESGLSTEYRETLDLKDVVKEIKELFQEEARKKGVELVLNVEDRDFIVEADRKSIEMIVTNLVSNAIKYNRENGKVFISLGRKGDFVSLTVEDTGVGIPKEDLPKIFDRFYRVKSGDTRKIVGSGLGLSIVKALVDKLGGKIEVDSEVGKGTRFTVLLPLK